MDYKQCADEIVERISMPELLEHYGFEVNRAGFMCCPFHNEKTPSFHAYNGKGGFHCFGCGEHGNVISFVMKYDNLRFPDALKKINEDFALGLPINQKITRNQRVEIGKANFLRKREKEKRQKELFETRERYYDLLMKFERLSKQYHDFKPKPGETELNPKFIEALKDLPMVNFLIDYAQQEVRDCENRMFCN